MPFDHKRIQAGRTLHAQHKLLANALQRACRRRRWAVVTLAYNAGVPLETTQKAMAGRGKQQSFWTIARLAKALHLDLNYLAGLHPEQKGRPHGRYAVL